MFSLGERSITSTSHKIRIHGSSLWRGRGRALCLRGVEVWKVRGRIGSEGRRQTTWKRAGQDFGWAIEEQLTAH